jgi:hypothetical protein
MSDMLTYIIVAVFLSIFLYKAGKNAGKVISFLLDLTKRVRDTQSKDE